MLDKIFDIMEEVQAKMQQQFKEFIQAQLGQGGNLNQQAIMDTLEKAGKEMNKAVERIEKELLTPAQRKRLQEIDLQQRGYIALSIPAVAKVLELTPKQKEQLEENTKKVSDELSQLTPTPPGLPGRPRAIGPGAIDNEKQEKERAKIRAEGLKRAVAVLTENQQAVWKKLVGAPVAFSLDTNTRTQGPVFFGGFGGVMPAPPIPPVVIPPPAVPPKPAPKPPVKE